MEYNTKRHVLLKKNKKARAYCSHHLKFLSFYGIKAAVLERKKNKTKSGVLTNSVKHKLKKRLAIMNIII